MTNSDSVSYLTSEFDDFLFARINADSDDTPLSVLSVLARLGVDPWDEARSLAQLPRVSAARRLVSLIATLPSAPPSYLNSGTVSDRLISLLPSPPAVTILPRLKSGVPPLTRTRFTIWMLVAVLLVVIQLIVVSRQPPAQPTEAHGTPASTASPLSGTRGSE